MHQMHPLIHVLSVDDMMWREYIFSFVNLYFHNKSVSCFQKWLLPAILILAKLPGTCFPKDTVSVSVILWSNSQADHYTVLK